MLRNLQLPITTHFQMNVLTKMLDAPAAEETKVAQAKQKFNPQSMM